MKWFKHMTGARHDDKIKNIKQWFGREGVCRYWEILEIIAEQMNESQKCSVTMDERIWKHELGFYKLQDLHKYLRSLADVGLISVRCEAIVGPFGSRCVTVLCDKLLKIRDHRIKNRVQKSAPEVEADREAKANTPIVPKGTTSTESFSSHFSNFWNCYPKKVGKRAAWAAWRRHKLGTKIVEILKAVESQKKSEQWQRDGGQYIPNPATWLNQGRWDDEIQNIDPMESWVEQMRAKGHQ